MQQRTGCDTCGQPEKDDVYTVFGYKGMAHCFPANDAGSTCRGRTILYQFHRPTHAEEQQLIKCDGQVSVW